MNVAFTLVLNGMPFIKQQYEIIPQVFDKWYIVEGVASPVKDTAWCKPADAEFYDANYLSVDGTTEFLDSIKSEKIVIIRNNNQPWNGKVDMCNSFMNDLPENTTLMQVDVDEIWNVDTLGKILKFGDQASSDFTMCFRCNYFVGPNIKIISQDTYGDMPYEWYRLWHIASPGAFWLTHEPPTLNIPCVTLDKNFTTSQGWVFDHHAYVYEQQVKFKETYYGYSGAVESWKKLQEHREFPCLLHQFLPWVRDNAIVDRIIL
jgi:hypothetical protein